MPLIIDAEFGDPWVAPSIRFKEAVSATGIVVEVQQSAMTNSTSLFGVIRDATAGTYRIDVSTTSDFSSVHRTITLTHTQIGFEGVRAGRGALNAGDDWENVTVEQLLPDTGYFFRVRCEGAGTWVGGLGTGDADTWARSYTQSAWSTSAYGRTSRLSSDVVLPTPANLAATTRKTAAGVHVIDVTWSTIDVAGFAATVTGFGVIAAAPLALIIEYGLQVVDGGRSYFVYTATRLSITGTGSNTVSATIPNLQPSTEYRLAIRTVAAGFTASPYSAEITVRTGGNVAPPRMPPPIVQSGQFYSDMSSGFPVVKPEIPVSWTREELAENYDLRWQKIGTSVWQTANYPAATLSTRIRQGLDKGTSYTFQVRAKNSAGAGPWSNSSRDALTIQDASSPPGQMAAPTLEVRSQSIIRVRWVQITDGQFYNLRYREAPVGATPGGFSTISPRGANIFQYDLTGLRAGIRYEVQTQAANSATINRGRGPWSPSTYATTLTYPPEVEPTDPEPIVTPPVDPGTGTTPPTPTGPGLLVPTIGGVSDSEIDLTWVTSDLGLTFVWVRWRKQGSTDWTYSGSLPPYKGHYRINFVRTAAVGDVDLDPATVYEIQLQAWNTVGSGDWTTAVTASTLPAENVPPPVAAPTVVAESETAAVSWTAPAASPPILRFEVWFREGPQYSVAPVAAADTSITLTALVPEKRYEFRVRAVNREGAGALSVATFATTKPAVRVAARRPPPKPDPPTLEVLSAVSIHATWKETRSEPHPGEPDTAAETTDYALAWRIARATEPDPAYPHDTLLVDSDGNSLYTTIRVGGPQLGFTLLQLTQGTEYIVHVAGINGAGQGPWSDGAAETTLVAGARRAPIAKLKLPALTAAQTAAKATPPAAGCHMDLLAWIAHPDDLNRAEADGTPVEDAYTFVGDKITQVTIQRGLDRQSRVPNPGSCTLVSKTAKPWITPLKDHPTAWYQADLITEAVVVIGLRINFDKWEPVFSGYVMGVDYTRQQQLTSVDIRGSDLWGAKIATQYIDVPPIEAGDTTGSFFSKVMELAGYEPGIVDVGFTHRPLGARSFGERKQRLVDVLNQIAVSENGYMFITRAGDHKFRGSLPAPPTPVLYVSDDPADTGAAKLASPISVRFDRARMANAMIGIDNSSLRYDRPYSTERATEHEGSVLDDSGYTVPYSAVTGQGRGASGANEIVRSDPDSIRRHGRIELRMPTLLDVDEALLLTEDALADRKQLQPYVRSARLLLHHEPGAIASAAVSVDLDSTVSLEFEDSDTGLLFAEVAPVEGIQYQITPEDALSLGTVHVAAVYTLYRHSGREWWLLGTSTLGENTFVAPGRPNGARSTATPDSWVDGELVDAGGVGRITQQTIPRYSSPEDADEAEAAVSSIWSPVRLKLVGKRLRLFDTRTGRERTVARLR